MSTRFVGSLASRASAVVFSTAAALMIRAPLASAKVDANITAVATAASITEIENIVQLGITFGTQMARGEVKLTTENVKKLVSGLTKAIKSKHPASPADPNRTENKVDEIGEVAAYVLGAISGDDSSTKKGKLTSNLVEARKYALTIIKAALKRTVKSAEFLRTDIVSDVVGSVALTIHSNPAYDQIEAKLKKSLLAAAGKMAGKAEEAIVIKALNTAFVGDPLTSGFEYGNDLPVAFIADPETDFRNN